MPVAHVVIRLPAGRKVGAVASFGNEVFLVRCDSHAIEVYDAVDFTLQRRLAVPGLGTRPYGLAVSASNMCLYASDFNNDSVHRVELSGTNAVEKWTVARFPTGVTVNSGENLVVVSYGESKLQKFSTHGTLLRNIQLHTNAGQNKWSPWHALQLANGQFLVSRRATPHGVCLVDNTGAVVRSYGGQSGLTKMNGPAGLAVDKDGRILIADQHNGRLLVLDHSVTNAHVMSVFVDGGLSFPRTLWYDKSRGRLYIGEGGQGRVIVVDHLKDFAATQV